MRLVWFGHSAFRLELADKVILIDPFLTGNPTFTGDVATASQGATHVLITHGHSDHIGDTADIAARTGATVVANFEVCMWLGTKGVTKLEMANTGGTVDLGGVTATFVRADHSATVIEDGTLVPLGNPNGIVVRAPGEPTVYHLGDTAVFGDMALVQEMYAPDILLAPIGDRFTMGAADAAFAVKRFFKPRAVVPCHYGTFPIIAPNADAFVAAMEGSGIQVVVPQVGTGVRFDA